MRHTADDRADSAAAPPGAGADWLMEPATALDALLDPDHPRKVAASQWAAEHLGGGAGRDTWQACGAAGLFGVMVPAEHGGLGRTAVEALLSFEGLGHGCSDAGLVFALASQVFAFGSCFMAGASADQRARYLPGILAGDLVGAFAMTEPEVGSDTAAITTTSTRVEGGYVLAGTKTWVTLGPLCDLAIVFATVAPERGRWGITAFLVERDTPGFERSGPIEKMGLRSSPFGRIELRGCQVPEANRLGPEGAGAQLFASAVQAERAYLYAAQVGATQRLLERCIGRAQEREQFGVPIGNHQAVSHPLVDVAIRLETARLLILKTAALADDGRSVAAAAAMAKIEVSQTAVAAAVQALHLFGAEGYTVDAGIEVYLRDAVGGLAYSGTSDIQRNMLARLLHIERHPRRRKPT
jgi:hypothetical protein